MAADNEDLTAERIDARIQQHRTAAVTLTIVDSDGKPLADAPVTVRQVRHKFLFGCNAFMIAKPGLRRGYEKRFAGLLNFATLPFYWGAFERLEGKPDTEHVKQMARWCRDNGIRTKGHPLCWNSVPPKWLAGKSPEQVEKLQMSRTVREVKAFIGLVDTWDVVNEAVAFPNRSPKTNEITKLCIRLGRVEMIKRSFAAARKTNPDATLILNDFDTSAKYEKLIRDCLDAGVRIDVIGIQSHMHKRYWGAKRAWDVCQRFAKFGRPLHFTELTILSGKRKTDSDWNRRRPGWVTTPEGEKRQATHVEELYRVLFSHPAVEAITWWDFSDQGAWQGAPAGLVRKDMTPKPAYEVLMRLVKKEWWTGEKKLRTNAAGQATFRGFLGTYALEASAGKAEFDLHAKGKVKLTVRLGK